MDQMMKMLEKKKKDGKELDPMYKDSKMSVLKELRDQMSGLMKEDLDPSKMKKVEVAASNQEGLKHGLDKAKDMLGEMPEEANEGSPEEEGSESPEEKAEEMAEGASDEDLDAMIKKLEEMKQKKSMMV